MYMLINKSNVPPWGYVVNYATGNITHTSSQRETSSMLFDISLEQWLADPSAEISAKIA